ncbi:hypothetical protein MASR2M117_06910 [Paludibacter sp.]
MKTSTKICVVITLILLFPCSTVFSQKTGQINFSVAAEEYVTKLSLDVPLTDTQKDSLKTSVVDYFTRMNQALKNTDKIVRDEDVLRVEQSFKQQTDSILTDFQKNEIEMKNMTRVEASTTKDIHSTVKDENKNTK